MPLHLFKHPRPSTQRCSGATSAWRLGQATNFSHMPFLLQHHHDVRDIDVDVRRTTQRRASPSPSSSSLMLLLEEVCTTSVKQDNNTQMHMWYEEMLQQLTTPTHDDDDDHLHPDARTNKMCEDVARLCRRYRDASSCVVSWRIPPRPFCISALSAAVESLSSSSSSSSNNMCVREDQRTQVQWRVELRAETMRWWSLTHEHNEAAREYVNVRNIATAVQNVCVRTDDDDGDEASEVRKHFYHDLRKRASALSTRMRQSCVVGDDHHHQQQQRNEDESWRWCVVHPQPHHEWLCWSWKMCCAIPVHVRGSTTTRQNVRDGVVGVWERLIMCGNTTKWMLAPGTRADAMDAMKVLRHCATSTPTHVSVVEELPRLPTMLLLTASHPYKWWSKDDHRHQHHEQREELLNAVDEMKRMAMQQWQLLIHDASTLASCAPPTLMMLPPWRCTATDEVLKLRDEPPTQRRRVEAMVLGEMAMDDDDDDDEVGEQSSSRLKKMEQLPLERRLITARVEEVLKKRMPYNNNSETNNNNNNNTNIIISAQPTWMDELLRLEHLFIVPRHDFPTPHISATTLPSLSSSSSSMMLLLKQEMRDLPWSSTLHHDADVHQFVFPASVDGGDGAVTTLRNRAGETLKSTVLADWMRALHQRTCTNDVDDRDEVPLHVCCGPPPQEQSRRRMELLNAMLRCEVMQQSSNNNNNNINDYDDDDGFGECLYAHEVLHGSLADKRACVVELLSSTMATTWTEHSHDASPPQPQDDDDDVVVVDDDVAQQSCLLGDVFRRAARRDHRLFFFTFFLQLMEAEAAMRTSTSETMKNNNNNNTRDDDGGRYEMWSAQRRWVESSSSSSSDDDDVGVVVDGTTTHVRVPRCTSERRRSSHTEAVSSANYLPMHPFLHEVGVDDVLRHVAMHVLHNPQHPLRRRRFARHAWNLEAREDALIMSLPHAYRYSTSHTRTQSLKKAADDVVKLRLDAWRSAHTSARLWRQLRHNNTTEEMEMDDLARGVAM